MPDAKPADAAVYTIKEFCRAHRISEAMFHKLRKQGLGPPVMRVGRRTYVTLESAAEWRRQRERESA